MIEYYKNGDIILNFYRSVVYVFDEKNPKHRADYNRCRIASFDEISQYKKLNKPIVKLTELKGCNFTRTGGMRWNYREYITIKFVIDDYTLLRLHHLANSIGLDSYLSLIKYLLNKKNPKVIEYQIQREIKEDKREIKEKQKKIDSFINAFKELLK